MQININTQSYNDRRYSSPWIAIVDFSENPNGDFAFGNWIGRKGEAGILQIESAPGQIVAKGQKDYRKPKNSTTEFFIVQSDGTLSEAITKAEAYTHFSSAKTANPFDSFSDDEILAEAKARGLI